MPFLSPSQQCQKIEGTKDIIIINNSNNMYLDSICNILKQKVAESHRLSLINADSLEM